MRRLKAILERLALLLVSVVVTTGLLETGVRIFMPQQLIAYQQELYQPDDLVGWRHTPNLDTVVNTGERSVRFVTDSQGFRISGENQLDPAFRILAIGDSFVQGLQVDYEQSMTGLLEASLSEEMGYPVAVVNDGVAGWGPTQYALEAEREIGRQSYDLVVVFLYTGNDISEIQTTQFVDDSQITIRHTFRSPRSMERQEIVDALLYPINDLLEARSHLYVLVRTRLKSLLIRLGLSPYYLPETVLRSHADSTAWDVTADVCQTIAEEAAQRNIPVIFVLLPDNYRVDQELFDEHARLYEIDPTVVDLDQPSRLMVEALQERGLVVVDMLDALRAAHQLGNPFGEIYGSVDTHFGPGGHAVVAEVLRPILGDALRSGE